MLMPLYRPFSLAGPFSGQPDRQPSGFGHYFPVSCSFFARNLPNFPFLPIYLREIDIFFGKIRSHFVAFSRNFQQKFSRNGA
jgi:hypothetical protein